MLPFSLEKVFPEGKVNITKRQSLQIVGTA